MRALAISLVLLGCAGAMAGDAPVKVYVNGRPIDTTVMEINGKLYAPIDDISKALGVTVTVQSNAPAEATAPAAVLLATPPRPSVAPAVRGLLTFQFNILQSKPDVGAQVWLVNDTDVAALAASLTGKPTEPIPQAATDWEPKLAGYPHAVADNRGEFSFDNVPAGAYCLILKSAHANGLAARDRQGKCRFKKIVVRGGQPQDVSFNFGMAAYIP